MVYTITLRNFTISEFPHIAVQICFDELAPNPNPSAIIFPIAFLFSIRVAMKSEAVVNDSFSFHIFLSLYRVISSPTLRA